MDFIMSMIARRVEPDNGLRKVNVLIDCQQLAQVLCSVRYYLGRAARGHPLHWYRKRLNRLMLRRTSDRRLPIAVLAIQSPVSLRRRILGKQHSSPHQHLGVVAFGWFETAM